MGLFIKDKVRHPINTDHLARFLTFLIIEQSRRVFKEDNVEKLLERNEILDIEKSKLFLGIIVFTTFHVQKIFYESILKNKSESSNFELALYKNIMDLTGIDISSELKIYLKHTQGPQGVFGGKYLCNRIGIESALLTIKMDLFLTEFLTKILIPTINRAMKLTDSELYEASQFDKSTKYWTSIKNMLTLG